jgi:three-Cys-motif partner protein
MEFAFGDIGYWSEIKLEIVRKYAKAYNTVLANRHPHWPRVYVDAFAGPGVHISRDTREFVTGSPLNALRVEPCFTEYHFIDIDGDKINALRQMVGDREDVHTYAEDANTLLLRRVFPRIRYEDYRRGLCLLDPCGLDLDWEVIYTAGSMRSIEIFLNFPIMDINRNVLHKDPDSVTARQKARMTSYWGDDSWRSIAYETEGNLFGFEEKVSNEQFAAAFQNRLKSVAGFAHVPDPIPMRNSTGSVVYYIYFASQQPVAEKIVRDIFDKYR